MVPLTPRQTAPCSDCHGSGTHCYTCGAQESACACGHWAPETCFVCAGTGEFIPAPAPAEPHFRLRESSPDWIVQHLCRYADAHGKCSGWLCCCDCHTRQSRSDSGIRAPAAPDAAREADATLLDRAALRHRHESCARELETRRSQPASVARDCAVAQLERQLATYAAQLDRLDADALQEIADDEAALLPGEAPDFDEQPAPYVLAQLARAVETGVVS